MSGRVTARGEACAAVRVDLFLTDPGGTGERLPLGVLVTGPEGRYDGAVVVPPRAAARDHVVRARTPGGPSCGPGESP
ncbi:MAG: hypothetical protein FJ104_08640 [Deltaproteobacteria bacterium]|nr:hypothetical protein [Deltaproteobacteria bacterium]